MKVILISGKAGHGKDTLATLMRKYLEANNKKVLTIHFGDPVKWLARDFLGWDGDKTTVEGRNILQTLGTNIMRTAYPTYWAEIIAKFISAVNMWDYVLIPDWRFENEFETVYQYNELVTTVRIERYNQDGTFYRNPNMTMYQLLHVSECQLDKFPFEWIVENRGTTNDLKDSVEVMLEHI